MARKAESFRVDTEKKILIVYTNVTASEAEKEARGMYLANGYEMKFEKKKPSKTVKQMRKELEADENALKAFNEAYKKKNGFFEACKIYQNWSKKNK